MDYEPHLSRYELELFHRSQRNNFVARMDLDEHGVAGLQITPVRQTKNWSVRLENERERQDTFDIVEWSSHPLNHIKDGRPEPCSKFWVSGWAYLAIQYPSIWLHLKRRPSYIGNALRWFFREETFRLQWGAIFAHEVPGWFMGLRGGLIALARLPLRLLKKLLGKGGK